ncbi:MAG: YHS domain-containing (seleno)protein [Pseudomonadota bacterium]
MRLRSMIAAALIVAAPATIAAPVAYADKAPVYTSRFSNVAVQGYDPVAYFTVGEATKGAADYSTTYKGAEFRFASQENLDLFLGDPEAYAPQYGGYCAWALADGRLAKGDARYWRIVDGKLYLNYSRGVQQKWLADIPGFIAKANANWPSILTA